MSGEAISLTLNDSIKKSSKQFDIALLGEKALSTIDLDEFEDEIILLLSKSLGTEFVKILHLTDDKKKLRLIKSIGFEDDLIENVLIDPDFNSQAGYTLVTNKPVVVYDINNESRFKPHPLLTSHNIKSGISIVISGLNGPYGVLGAHSTKKINFSENDINFIHSMSLILSLRIIQQKSIELIKNTEEKYRALTEYASDPIIISDLDGQIIEVNEKACQMTQFSKSELISRNIDTFYDQEDYLKNLLTKEELINGEHHLVQRTIIRKDKSKVPVEISLKVLPDKKFVQGIIRDISVRKETEKLIQDNQKMQALTRVSGGIAHDFNNYLTIIMGYAEKIITIDLEELDTQEIKQNAESIKKTTGKASKLVKNLLSFSQKKHYTTQIIDVNDVIKELEKPLDSFLSEKIQLHLELQSNLNKIDINPDQLQESLINLIINAKDAIGQSQHGKITIQTFDYILDKPYKNYAFKANPGRFIGISVQDNGIGMSDEIKSHLFEPFFTTKDSTKGFGLGLSSVYGFISEFNGFITVESDREQGSKITLFLKESFKNEINLLNEVKIAVDSVIKKTKTIALIEDNIELLELMSSFLLKRKFKIYTAHNGIEGLEMIKDHENEIDIIVSDIIMPELDGLEMLTKLKELHINKRTILMSGYSITDPLTLDKVKYGENITFIPKPVSLDDLCQFL